MDKYSYISNSHSAYIDELYASYVENPENVDISWQRFFEGFEFSQQKYGEVGPSDDQLSTKEAQVRSLIHAYRSMGHLKSDTNPVRPRRDHNVRLVISDFGLTERDLEEEFEVGKLLGIG